MVNNVSGPVDWGFKLLLLSICLSLLPQSPFASYVSLVNEIPYLQYLNWFVPIDGIFAVMEVWLQVVLVYMGYMITLRYANALKGS